MRTRSVIVTATLVLAGCMGMGGGMGGRGGGVFGGMGRGGRYPGGGGAGGNRGGDNGQVQAPGFPSLADVQRYNPATLLIDRKSDLALPDTQVGTLVSLRKRMFDRDLASFSRYDTLQRAYRPGQNNNGYGRGRTRDPNQVEGSDSAYTVMQKLRSAIDSLSAHRLLDETDALAIVTDDAQRQKAAGFLAAQDRDYRALFPPTIGGRGRGRGE